MSKAKTVQELVQHKTASICKIDKYIDDLINSGKDKEQSKADKISYWIEDWTTFLQTETQFNPMNLKSYKRGEIVKVHLGFNVGSEEGGLHYAVVLDKKNPKSSPVLTVVPLTSVKSQTDVSNLKTGSVFLDNEIFLSLNAKISSTRKQVNNQLQMLQNCLNPTDASEQIAIIQNKLKLLKRMQTAIQNMKKGSIALTNQITTVSKMRIYDPKNNYDILSGIKLSNAKLDLIDNEIKKMYLK